MISMNVKAIGCLLIAGLLTTPQPTLSADQSPDTPSLQGRSDDTPTLEGDVHRWPVRSQPASTPELSRQLLQVQSRAAVETYLEKLFASPDAAASILPDDAWIEGHLAPDLLRHGEVRQGDVVLYESAGVLLFDEQDRLWLRERWRAHQVEGRLKWVTALAIPTVLLAILLLSVASKWVYRVEQRRATA